MYLTQGLHRSVQVNAGQTATVFGDRRQSWAALKERVARFAGALKARGLKRGERVAIIAHNSDRYIESIFGVAWAGGVIVPGNTRWAVPEHIYALQDSGAKYLLLDRSFAHMAGPLTDACGIECVIYLDDDAPPADMFPFEKLLSAAEPIPDGCGEGEELAALFYTGGTTGRSKGVMLSHRSLISNFLAAHGTAPYRADSVFLHSPPMFHAADAAAIIGITMMGGTHVIIPFFTPEGVVRTIEAERVTEAVFVPTMFGMLRDHLAKEPADLTSVRGIIYGASAISEALLKEAMKIFPNAAFLQAYGQTELSPVATILPPECHHGADISKLRSAGRSLPGVDVRIVDDEMKEVPLGEVGEIAVKSPGAMLGYWNQPDVTARTIVNGWLRTGDAGYMDEDGFVFLVDRVKDMIVSGGENVYSAEVENALAANEAVAECAVIGVPDERWGERVHAIVRLKNGHHANEADLITHCKTLIAGYKCPRSVELRADPLPLSGAGKILKTELRKPYWEGHARSVG